MLSIDISPDIATAIISNHTRWYNNEPYLDISSGNHLLALAIQKQTQIGRQLLEDFWVKEWDQIQKLHLISKSSPKSSELLISKARRRVWKITWSMWLQRNDMLLSVHKSIHPQEQIHLDEELQ